MFTFLCRACVLKFSIWILRWAWGAGWEDGWGTNWCVVCLNERLAFAIWSSVLFSPVELITVVYVVCILHFAVSYLDVCNILRTMQLTHAELLIVNKNLWIFDSQTNLVSIFRSVKNLVHVFVILCINVFFFFFF